MNAEIKKWRAIKKELSAKKVDYLELDSEDLPDYGNDTPHAITIKGPEDEDFDYTPLFFALRKIDGEYLIEYGEDLSDSDEDTDASVEKMINAVLKEISGRKALGNPEIY